MTTATETLTKQAIIDMLVADIDCVEDFDAIIEVFMIDEDGEQSETLTESPVFDAIIDGQLWADNESTLKGVYSLIETYNSNRADSINQARAELALDY